MSQYVEAVRCPRVQQGLEQFAGENPSVMMDQERFLGFLLDPMNRQGTLPEQISPGNAKKRKVELTWFKRESESIVEDTPDLDCDGGAEPEKLSEEYELPDVGSRVTWTIDPRNLRDDCEGNGNWVARTLMRKLDVLERAIATKTIAEASMLTGSFAGDTQSPVSVRTRTADGSFSHELLESVTHEFMEMNSWSVPFIFGGGEVNKYFRAMAHGCCSNNLNIDLGSFAEAHEQVFMYDRKIPAQFGDNNFVAMAAGALQLLTFNDNMGEDGVDVIDETTVQKGVIQSPRTGMLFDYYVEWDCGKWNFYLGVHHMLVGLPDGMFEDDDRLNGVKWFNQFVVDNS